MRLRPVPVQFEFCAPLLDPFSHQSQGTWWKRAGVHVTGRDHDERHVAAVARMEVRRRMVAEVHLDDDPVERADAWHQRIVPGASDLSRPTSSPRSGPIQATLQSRHDRLEVRSAGARTVESLDQLTIIEPALAKPPGSITVDFPGHELAEDGGDRSIAGEDSKVCPYVIGDVDSGHAVAANRLRRRLGPRSLPAAAAHGSRGIVYE